jgi:N-acetyl-anhydromuramyl-L-alanine amidase AmpD
MIKEKSYRFTKAPTRRTKTQFAIIHHADAPKATPEQIHAWHLARGYSGIGYHFVISKDGAVFRGRDLNVVGAHALNFNSVSVGICLEGALTRETPPKEQLDTLIELLSELRQRYPGIVVAGHKNFNATACPGNLDMARIVDMLKEKEATEVRYQKVTDIPAGELRNVVEELVQRGFLKGDQEGNLDLSMDMIRIFAVNYRAGVYK